MVSITDEYMGISQLFLAMFPCCLLPKSVPVHRAFVAVDEKILQAITHFLFNREKLSNKRRISVVFSITSHRCMASAFVVMASMRTSLKTIDFLN